MNLIQKAADLAARAHKGQFRKYCDNVEYIVHPAAVAAYVECLPNVPDYVVAAAWGHDICEDCEQSFIDELHAFPQEVVKLVYELTNPSKGVKASRSVRKQMDRDHLKTVSLWARKIKLIDRFCNLNDCKDTPQDFLRLYLVESQLLLDALVGTDPVLEQQLQKAITEGGTHVNGNV